MSTSNLREYFGKLLKRHIKKAGLRQLDIAAALGLSPSAICQMISGKISPNLKQLDIIMEKLSLDRNECAELRDCLSRIRTGDEELRSPLNDFIRSSRTQQGLSVEQLSEMSGIPVENLIMLENKFNTQPTPYEAIRLAAIFNCNVSELWQVMPGGESLPDNNKVYGNTPQSVTMIRERVAPYTAPAAAGIKIPIVGIEALQRFDARSDMLVEFAWRHMCGYESDRKFGTVIVKASGVDYGWADFYDALIEVIDNHEWIPGMTVLALANGEVILGKAAEEQYQIIPMGDEDSLECQWYCMVTAFRFASDLLEVVNQRQNERKRRQRRITATPMRQKPNSEENI